MEMFRSDGCSKGGVLGEDGVLHRLKQSVWMWQEAT